MCSLIIKELSAINDNRLSKKKKNSKELKIEQHISKTKQNKTKPRMKEEFTGKWENILNRMKIKMYQNLWVIPKIRLRGKFTALNKWVGKEERFKIDDRSLFMFCTRHYQVVAPPRPWEGAAFSHFRWWAGFPCRRPSGWLLAVRIEQLPSFSKYLLSPSCVPHSAGCWVFLEKTWLLPPASEEPTARCEWSHANRWIHLRIVSISVDERVSGLGSVLLLWILDT